jgi:hypothetical protein
MSSLEDENDTAIKASTSHDSNNNKNNDFPSMVVNEQQFSQAIQEISKLAFFRVHPIQDDLELMYTDIPSSINWDDLNCLQEYFPPSITNKRQRQVPRCLLLAATSPTMKLVVVHWWRCLIQAQQAEIMEALKHFYRAPKRSSSPLLQRHLGKTKETSRPKEPTRPWGFLQIATGQELATKLNVPLAALVCLQIDESKECCIDSCVYPQVLANRYHCCLHRRTFYPTTGRITRCRGNYLLGTPYVTNHREQCSCTDPICEGIGYSTQSVGIARHIPKQTQSHKEILYRLLPNRPQGARLFLAPWHFHPQHRILLPNHTWRVKLSTKTATFHDPTTLGADDSDNNNANEEPWIGVPPPTYPLSEFLKEPEMVSLKHQNPLLLPSWVQAYQSKEQGPRTILQYQNALRETQHQELLAQLQDRVDTYHNLEHDHAQLQEDYDQLQGKYKKQQRQLQQQRKNSTTPKQKKKRKVYHHHPMDHESTEEDKEEEEEEEAEEPMQVHINGQMHINGNINGQMHINGRSQPPGFLPPESEFYHGGSSNDMRWPGGGRNYM